MKILKKLTFIIACLSYSVVRGQVGVVEKLNIGIFPVTSTVTISEEQTNTIKAKLKKAFVEKIRFTVFDGDSLNSDSFINLVSAAEKGKEVKVNNPNKIDYLVVAYVNGLRAVNQSVPSTSGGYDKGASATTAMKIKIIDLKSNKIIFDEGLFHSEFYKNKTTNEAMDRSINAFCSLFKDLVNYVFPVELTINGIETSNKKGTAETVTIKNAEYMYIYLKKGFLDYPDSKFEVYYLNEDGKKEVVGKLQAKEIIDGKIICEVDKGGKEITKLLNENKTLYLTILDNTIEYYVNQRKK